MGAMLFNISFVVGGSPDAGWTSYFPLAGNDFSPSVGTNYYMIGYSDCRYWYINDGY